MLFIWIRLSFNTVIVNTMKSELVVGVMKTQLRFFLFHYHKNYFHNRNEHAQF